MLGSTAQATAPTTHRYRTRQRRPENGRLVLTNPMAGNRTALIAADDIGKTALGVLRRILDAVPAHCPAGGGDRLDGDQRAIRAMLDHAQRGDRPVPGAVTGSMRAGDDDHDR